MPLCAFRLLTFVALVPAQVLAQPVDRAVVPIELRQDALVGRGRITLSDVALIHTDVAQAQQLAAVPLGRPPRIGHVERMNRAQIEQAVQRHSGAPFRLKWTGAAAVAVRTQAQPVSAQAIKEAAMLAAQERFGSAGVALAIDLAVPLADIDVPIGTLAVRARPLVTPLRDGRASVWVDLWVDEEIYRSAIVLLTISVRRPAYVAVRDIAVGAHAGMQDFELAMTEVGSGIDIVTAEQPPQPFRAAHTIRAGQALTRAAVLAGGRVLRGDAVRVQMREGQIGIDTVAIAMNDAGPGQALRVRPAGTQDVVTGRVSPSGAVILE